jgi:hypothetical protein
LVLEYLKGKSRAKQSILNEENLRMRKMKRILKSRRHRQLHDHLHEQEAERAITVRRKRPVQLQQIKCQKQFQKQSKVRNFPPSFKKRVESFAKDAGIPMEVTTEPDDDLPSDD